MLVLSRKPNQEFVFPNLGISVRLLKVDGKQVRLGVDAPRDIEVLRGELVQATQQLKKDGINSHELNNRLNTVKLQLHLSERLLERQDFDGAEKSLREAVHQLALLECDAIGHAKNGNEKARDRVLVVDDDVNELRLMGGILELEGYNVQTSPDGYDALDKLHQHEFDFVMLDMLMPRCDGPETIKRIRADEALRHLKVLSVSGTSPESLGVPIGHNGVDAWYAKPLDPAGLLKDLERMRLAVV